MGVEVTTEHGSVYVFDDDYSKVLRVSEHNLRGDNEWLVVVEMYAEPVVGESIAMIVQLPDTGAQTLRTSGVVLRKRDV